MATHAEIQHSLADLARMFDHKNPVAWARERADIWERPLADFDSGILAHVAETYPERSKWLPKLADLMKACRQAPGELRAAARARAADAEGCDDCDYTGRRHVAVHTVGGTGRRSDVYDGAGWHRYSAACDCPLGRGFSDVQHDMMAGMFPEALAVHVTDAARPRFTPGGELVGPVTWEDLRKRLRTPSLRLVAQKVLGGTAPPDVVSAVMGVDPDANQAREEWER